jgi:hypothetical protein
VVMKEFVDAGIIIGTGLLLPDDEDELEDEDSLAAVSNTQLHYGVAALPKDRLCEVLIDLMYRMPAVKKALIKELGTSLSPIKAPEGQEIKVRIMFLCKGPVLILAIRLRMLYETMRVNTKSFHHI